MILEYLYTNNAWGKIKIKYLFNITNKKVYWSKNNSDLKEIAGIEEHEIKEMVFYIDKIKHLNLSNIQFDSYSGGFDRGITQYYLILNPNVKIKLGQDGDHIYQSYNLDIQNIVKLIDKYVGLANEFTQS